MKRLSWLAQFVATALTLGLMACGGGSSGSGSQLPPQSSTPDFTLLISPSTQSVNGGGSTTIALSATAIDGFSSSISVQVTGLSGGVSMSPGAITVDPGGIDILTSDLDAFRTALTSENRTLKRALTDPRLVRGVGNAYSDEILHAAQLSPISLTRKLTAEEWERLFLAARQTLQRWIERLQAEATVSFPEKVTAFRAGMAVHGRYGEPCPRRGEKVLRIRYADKETNYCARCQTGGKVLADRGLSRLLGSDWPRTLEELEALTRH